MHKKTFANDAEFLKWLELIGKEISNTSNEIIQKLNIAGRLYQLRDYNSKQLSLALQSFNNTIPEAKKEACLFLNLDFNTENELINSKFRQKISHEHRDHNRLNYDHERFLETMEYYERWRKYYDSQN